MKDRTTYEGAMLDTIRPAFISSITLACGCTHNLCPPRAMPDSSTSSSPLSPNAPPSCKDPELHHYQSMFLSSWNNSGALPNSSTLVPLNRFIRPHNTLTNPQIHDSISPISSASTEPLHRCDLCDVTCSSVDHLNTHIEGGKHKRRFLIANIDSNLKARMDPVLQYKEPGTWKCLACNIEMCCLSFATHLEGEKHRKKLKLWSAANPPSPSPPLRDITVLRGPAYKSPVPLSQHTHPASESHPHHQKRNPINLASVFLGKNNTKNMNNSDGPNSSAAQVQQATRAGLNAYAKEFTPSSAATTSGRKDAQKLLQLPPTIDVGSSSTQQAPPPNAFNTSTHSPAHPHLPPATSPLSHLEMDNTHVPAPRNNPPPINPSRPLPPRLTMSSIFYADIVPQAQHILKTESRLKVGTSKSMVPPSDKNQFSVPFASFGFGHGGPAPTLRPPSPSPLPKALPPQPVSSPKQAFPTQPAAPSNTVPVEASRVTSRAPPPSTPSSQPGPSSKQALPEVVASQRNTVEAPPSFAATHWDGVRPSAGPDVALDHSAPYPQPEPSSTAASGRNPEAPSNLAPAPWNVVKPYVGAGDGAARPMPTPRPETSANQPPPNVGKSEWNTVTAPGVGPAVAHIQEAPKVMPANHAQITQFTDNRSGTNPPLLSMPYGEPSNRMNSNNSSEDQSKENMHSGAGSSGSPPLKKAKSSNPPVQTTAQIQIATPNASLPPGPGLTPTTTMAETTGKPKSAPESLSCKPCDVVCSGIESFNEHMNSKGHQKKMENNNNEGGGARRCGICNVEVFGHQNFMVHVAGKAHMKKLKQKVLGGEAGNEVNEAKDEGPPPVHPTSNM